MARMDVRHSPPRVLASLVSHETTVDLDHNPRLAGSDGITPWHKLTPDERRLCCAVEPAAAEELEFRHGGWSATRRRVRDALAAAGTAGSVLDRFDNCGSGCALEMTLDGQKTRLRANYCHNRYCTPCATARSRRIRDALMARAAGVRCLFITLTIRSVPAETLLELLDHLYKSFARLRASKIWKRVKGGAYFTEITRGKLQDRWHPHLHIIAECDWLAQAALSAAWEKATSGSFRVDVRPCGDLQTVGRYVTTYATKGIGYEVLTDHGLLVECIVTLRGRRLCQPFGRWGKLALEDSHKPDDEWRRIGSLCSIVAGARRGDPTCHRWLRALGFVVTFDAGRARFSRVPSESSQVRGFQNGRPDGSSGRDPTRAPALG